MRTYLVHWGRDQDRTVSTAEELDSVLDQVERQRGDAGAPFMVDIVDTGADPELAIGLQIGVGHTERGFVFYTGQIAAECGYAIDRHLEPAVDEIGFDYGGQWTGYAPTKTRLTPTRVRELARAYVETGERPRGVEWFDASVNF